MTYETYTAKAARMNAALQAYQAAKAAADAAQAAAKTAREELAALLEKCPGREFYGETGRAYFKEYDRAGLDSAALRRDLWDVVAPYATTTHVKTLCIS